MNFFSLLLLTATLGLLPASHAENCDIHVPVKDPDLTGIAETGLKMKPKYESTINGYHPVPHTEAAAPFNLLLTDVVKFDGKNRYTIELTHASGFKKEYHFTMTDQDWNGHTLKDLSNLLIEKKMAEAKTVLEFQELKAKLVPEKNKVIPPMTELEFLLKQLPSCEKMFKKS